MSDPIAQPRHPTAAGPPPLYIIEREKDRRVARQHEIFVYMRRYIFTQHDRHVLCVGVFFLVFFIRSRQFNIFWQISIWRRSGEKCMYDADGAPPHRRRTRFYIIFRPPRKLVCVFNQ